MSNLAAPRTTLADLRRMSRAELHGVMCRGHALDPGALASAAYRGIDLSLPGWMHRLLWETFVKEFVRDENTDRVRGWNVRIEQTGVEGPIVPLRTRDGRRRTFGHYVVCTNDGRRFPQGWRGAHYLDYRIAGNTWGDPARSATAPLVAVNAGDMDLLLGWEIVNLGPLQIPLPDYWALVRLGPAAEVVPVPRPLRAPKRLAGPANTPPNPET